MRPRPTDKLFGTTPFDNDIDDKSGWTQSEAKETLVLCPRLHTIPYRTISSTEEMAFRSQKCRYYCRIRKDNATDVCVYVRGRMSCLSVQNGFGALQGGPAAAMGSVSSSDRMAAAWRCSPPFMRRKRTIFLTSSWRSSGLISLAFFMSFACVRSHRTTEHARRDREKARKA